MTKDDHNFSGGYTIKYIREKLNQDVCVSEHRVWVALLVSRVGKSRFTYFLLSVLPNHDSLHTVSLQIACGVSNPEMYAAILRFPGTKIRLQNDI